MVGVEPRVADREIEVGVVAALCAAAVAGLMSSSQLGPFVVDIADDLDQTVPLIGQAATAFLVLAALGGLFAGPIADHYGHRRVLCFGLVLTVVSAVGGGLAPNFIILLLTRLIGGVGFSASIGITFAIVSTRYSGAIRLRALSVVSGSLSLSSIVGVPLLTGVSAWLSWRGAWVLVGVLSAVSIGLLLRLVSEDSRDERARLTLRDILGSYRPLLGSRQMVLLFVGSACQGVMFMGAMTYAGAYFIDELGISVQRFGLVVALTGSAFAAGSFVAGRLSRFDLHVLFGLTMGLCGLILCAVFGLPTGVIGTVVLAMLGFFMMGVSVVTILGLLAGYTPTGQATTLVINESIFSLGGALGAAVGGLIISFGGYGALALMLPVFGLIGSLSGWNRLSVIGSREPAVGNR